MNSGSCPVSEALIELRERLDKGVLSHPRCRTIAEQALGLIRDIAWARAGRDHLQALEGLAEQLAAWDGDPSCSETGQHLKSALFEHHEAFASHIKTKNCPTGQCVRLAPAPCQMACPAGIDVPTYVTLIGMGRYDEAISVIRKDNPFPWVCGLVCTRPCEFMCVRGRMDEPVAIKPLKAFAAERAFSTLTYNNPPKAPDKGRKVAVIGAGPGGMSCAYYLAVMGYQVTVYEDLPVAGGMIMVGIPRYRLPREVIDREVAMIEELGVEIKFNTRFGRDVTFASLQEEGYEAFFVAVGAHEAYSLSIPGEKDFEGVRDAIAFLKDVALGERHAPGKHVVVVGGGNVAIDAARTSLRLGARSVTIAYRRDKDAMPADHEEVEQAEQEGIHFAYLTIPVEVVGENGRATGLKCLRAELVAKPGSDRMAPLPIEGSEFVMEADAIIAAIGQKVDDSCLADLTAVDWTHRNTLCVNSVSMETTMPGVFAAGDAVTGPATVIEAIGGGKRAAQGIDRYLSGLPQPKTPPVPVRRSMLPHLQTSAETKMTLERPEMPLLFLDRRRTTFQQVELGFDEAAAKEEARRCLRCDVCLRCGKCVEVCRDRMKVNALELGYFDFDHPVKTDFRKIEEKCILCGACATNCPNGAMQIRDEDGWRVLSLCGTRLNRAPLVQCSMCKEPLGTERYLEFVKNRASQGGVPVSSMYLCVNCARKTGAHSVSENLPHNHGETP
jgi:NADPH-dependent glutamate synthase beta subunit-like oxidoreductase|uniref:NADPH-dependent glutamate synthase beta chain n=1 Tax=Desulfatibacillum alkenivorans DSM 16219 TaxID=1121393 RepID=A0A1M6TCY9_9BACT|nr:NAD(P)-binding protein [Desulfatibacillum alkenivorans]SHK54734.1 NADPH-dependent glutamate synthase beta chain [Desulfatibacillum alkenivorans DSM 16219]